VLNGLRAHLMQPELFKEFCDEFTREVNRLRIDRRTDIEARRRSEHPCSGRCSILATRPYSISGQEWLALTLRSTNFYIHADGSPHGDSQGNAVREFSNAAAAPATVSDESFVICHWEVSVLGRRRKVTTRKPGDLPSAVVTREKCRSGSTGISFMWVVQSPL
jgi:hypothetical protein